MLLKPGRRTSSSQPEMSSHVKCDKCTLRRAHACSTSSRSARVSICGACASPSGSSPSATSAAAASATWSLVLPSGRKAAWPS